MSLVICTYIKDACYHLLLESDASLTIGSDRHDTLSLPDSGLEAAHFLFKAQKGVISLTAKKGIFADGVPVEHKEVSTGDVFTAGSISVYICSKKGDCENSIMLSEDREFLIGRSKECSFCLSDKRVSSRHAKIFAENGRYKIADLDSKNHTFVNGKRISTCYLEEGDMIFIASYEILFENNSLSFFNVGDDLQLYLDEKTFVKRYPFFRRSPRLGIVDEIERVEIQAPPYIGEKPDINWLAVFLPPLAMAAIMTASMLLTGGNFMSLMYFLPMSLITLFTTVISYFAQMRKYKRNKKKKVKSYDEYAEQVIHKIRAVYDSQAARSNRVHPETEYCYDIVSNRMRRLWERSAEDEDFLEIRLGKGDIPLAAEIVMPVTVVGEEINPQMQRLHKELMSFRLVKDTAVTLPVRKARTIGVVGNRQAALRTVQNIVVQLVTSHSYADVRLIIIAGERDYGKWEWTRWLPHIWDNNRKNRFLSSDSKQVAGLLSFFEDELKRRRDIVSGSRYGERVLLPHLVFVVTDYLLAENREFLSLISASKAEMGVSAFLMFENLGRLPKDCDWFIELGNSGSSVYSKTDSKSRTAFVPDAFDEYEKFARAIAPIRDRSVLQGGWLPAKITFLQGYDVTRIQEIDVLQRWEMAEPYKTLAVPIGVKEDGKIFLFDIHERFHGPHGLVAGTTGAGKSEVLQTYILSMCLNYSPLDVSFILIDFKGTGLVGSLRNLPHIAGVISNIDENIQRNLFSLEAEIDRRTKLFDKVSDGDKKIQDIYEYQREFHMGNLKEPLSHLIVVIDEFTELKMKFPDFMSAVDRASRVGRTLGIHLILATQKPGNSISDEIRANANFKWCLRVKEGESKEVIGRPEAEGILQEYPGRAYVQIGNNEIFELVQTFYSGAYIEKNDADSTVEISFVDACGHREKVTDSKKSGYVEPERELSSIVKYISQMHKDSGIPSARKIWEDALPDHLALSDVHFPECRQGFTAVLGLVDDPHHQRQYPFEIDLQKDGHLIIYGAPGTGKTLLLQTIMMSMAERYTPDEINMYVMDFGSWSMKNLQELPHVGGVANGNESEKITNLAKMLDESLNLRKTMFARVGAGSLTAYRQTTVHMLPALVVIVDNFAPVRELFPEVENVFIRLSREGGSYGIFLILTAVSLGGNISYSLSQNCKQTLSLWMTEKADYRDIVGDTNGLEPEKVPGRGLIRGNPPMEFQAALAVKAADDAEYTVSLKHRCRLYADSWNGNLPKEIPVMPDIVMFSHLKDIAPGEIAAGLSVDEIAPVIFPCNNRFLLISGTEESGKSNFLKVVAAQFPKEWGVIFTDAGIIADTDRQIDAAIERAVQGELVVLFIDNFHQWLSTADYSILEKLEGLIRNSKSNLFSLYAAGDALELAKAGGGIINRMLQSGYQVLLGGSFHEHSVQFEACNLSYQKQEEQLPAYHGYFIKKKKAVMFKALFYGGDENGI